MGVDCTLTATDMGALVGLSHQRIHQLRAEGLPCRVVGKGQHREVVRYVPAEVVPWLAEYRGRRAAVMSEKKVATKARQVPPVRHCRGCGDPVGRGVLRCPPCATARNKESRAKSKARTPYTNRASTPMWVLGAVADYHGGETVEAISVRVGASVASVNVYLRNAGADKAVHQAALRSALARSPEGAKAKAAWESGAPLAEVAEIIGLRSSSGLRSRAALMGWDNGMRRRSIAAAARARRGGLTVKEYRKAQSRARRHRRRQLHRDTPAPVVSGWCSYCLAPLPPGEGTVDHVTPIAHGGTHHIDNLVPACHACNSSKQDSDLLTWLTSRARAA